jgi:hypothetical protein
MLSSGDVCSITCVMISAPNGPLQRHQHRRSLPKRGGDGDLSSMGDDELASDG